MSRRLAASEWVCIPCASCGAMHGWAPPEGCTATYRMGEDDGLTHHGPCPVHDAKPESIKDRIEGAQAVRDRLIDTALMAYLVEIFGNLTSEDLAKIKQGIESAGYTMDSLSGHILRFGYGAAARVAEQVIEEIRDDE